MISHRGVDLIDLQLQHVEQFLVAQLVKDDNFVQPVDEFRVEGLPHGRHHHLFQLPARNIGWTLKAEGAALLNKPRADVRSHDNDRVFEIDGIAQGVGQDAVFENLEQHVENVGMRFLDFIEQ